MGGDCFAFGVETVCILAEAVQIAEERLLMTREREEADRYGNTDIDADLPAVGMPCKFTCKIPALRVNDRAVCIRIFVHHTKTFVEVLATFDAKYRTKHLVSADGHIVCDVIENGRADKVAVFIALNHAVSAVQNQFCALCDALIDIGKDFLIMLFVGNRT